MERPTNTVCAPSNNRFTFMTSTRQFCISWDSTTSNSRTDTLVGTIASRMSQATSLKMCWRRTKGRELIRSLLRGARTFVFFVTCKSRGFQKRLDVMLQRPGDA